MTIHQILDGVMCLFANQWTNRMLVVPTGDKHHENTLAYDQRTELAESLLFPRGGLLSGVLLISIGFFVIGFILQVWSITLSFDEPSAILILGAILVTIWSAGAAAILAWTTWHAISIKNSPFETPLSNSLRELRSWYLKRETREITKLVPENSEAKQGETPPDSSRRDLHKINLEEAIRHKTLEVYARLVQNTAETEVLEKAVPSFAYSEWYLEGDIMFSRFEDVQARFNATDTTFRVKETLGAQLIPFTNWLQQQSRIENNKIVRWCRELCNELYQQSVDTRPSLFPSWVFLNSLEQNSKYPWNCELTSENAVLRILHIFHDVRELGGREPFFRAAVDECKLLIKQGQITDDERVDILKSLIQSPHYDWESFEDLVSAITRGREEAILAGLSQFITAPQTEDQIDRGFRVLNLLAHFASSLPSDFTVSSKFNNLDLYQALLLLTRHPQDQDNWKKFRDMFLFYFDHGALDRLTHISPALHFLNRCRDEFHLSGSATNKDMYERATRHIKLFSARYPGDSSILLTYSALTAWISDFSVDPETTRRDERNAPCIR